MMSILARVWGTKGCLFYVGGWGVQVCPLYVGVGCQCVSHLGREVGVPKDVHSS